MTTTGIQGQLLEINDVVIGCRKLKDKEWLTRQDPYVVIDYASSKFRTKTDTDGGKNPSFNEKFTLPLIEGLREVHVQVWNSNSITYDDLIGTGKIQLEKALSTGYDDSTWPLISKSGKYAGEVRMILHYAHAKSHHQHQAHAPAPPGHYAAPAPGPYTTPLAAPYAGYYSAPQHAASSYSAYPSGYPPAHAPAGYPTAHALAGYPSQVASNMYPPHPATPYPPPAAPYPAPYPPSAYPPSPASGYGPPSGAYPPYPGGHPGYPSY